MAIIAEMTQLSPTMSEGTIVNWLKKEGDSVSPGEIIAEVETDKAVMEMEAYDTGVLLAILSPSGSKVSVGLPIAIIGDPKEDITVLKEQAIEKLNSTSPQVAGTNNSSTPNKPIDENKAEKEITNEIPTPQKLSKSESPHKPNVGRVIASPLAKSIAIQRSVDLKYVKGTGPGGRILQRDVYEYLNTTDPIQSDSSHDENIPISSMRKVIADRLTSSKSNIPHFYLNIEIDAEPLVAFRERYNQGLSSLLKSNAQESSHPKKISVNDIIVKATSLSLERHPVLNSSWRGDHILKRSSIDIGVAVSIQDGLLTPVVKNANHHNLATLSDKISQLVNRAQERKLKPEEFTGSSFTISNLGMFGISFFTAIINEPESAILAVGAIEEKPVVRMGNIVPGKRLQITLSCDHRVVDGAEGAQFLQTLRKILESPELLS